MSFHFDRISDPWRYADTFVYGGLIFLFGLKLAVTRQIGIRHPENDSDSEADGIIDFFAANRFNSVDGGIAALIGGIALMALGFLIMFSDIAVEY